MMYGYARVSTDDQNLNRQLNELRKIIPDERNIISDEESGKDFNRKGYNSLVGTADVAPRLREGDLLVICSIDRLGRNYTEIKQQWDYITNTLKANIKVLDMPLLDTSTNLNDNSLDKHFMADLVLQILAYVAEKERENIRKRQRQGIDVMPIVNGKKVSAKTGRATGRPNATYPDNWQEVYSEWKSGAITAAAAMVKLGIKKTTFYKLVKQYEA